MKWIKNLLRQKAGKLALTGLQALGLSAAVGVAGIAAWQMLSSSDDVNADTVFSAANDSEVVYVAGTSGANAYTGVSGYGDGGAVQSGINMRMSKDMKMMESDLINAKIAEQKTEMDTKEDSVKSFKMDGTSTGLGMDSAATDPQKMMSGLQGGGMPDIQSQIAALQQQAEAAQKKAAAEAGANAEAAQGVAAAGDALAQAQAALAGVSGGKWDMNTDIARAGGSALGATPLQAGAYQGKEGDALRAVQQASSNLPKRMKAADGTPVRFQGGRESTIGAGKNLDNARDTLEAATKSSIESLKNKSRSATEVTAVTFLADEKLADGIQLHAENVVTNGGTYTPDMIGDPDLKGKGFDAVFDDVQKEIDAYNKDFGELEGQFIGFEIAASVLNIASYFAKGLTGRIIWTVAYGLLAIYYGVLIWRAEELKKKWKDNKHIGYEKHNYHAKVETASTTAMAANALSLAGVWTGLLGLLVAGSSLMVMSAGMAFGDFGGSPEKEETKQEEIVKPTSPYGENVAEDALYLHNDMGGK